jgi:hypothetical protein
MTVKISSDVESRIVERLIHDVQATLGSGHEQMVRDAASSTKEIFNDNARIEEGGEPVAPEWDLEYFVERVVDDVQDTIHCNFVDTSWPRCPMHVHHPLWLKDEFWTCDKSGTRIAELGELEK